MLKVGLLCVLSFALVSLARGSTVLEHEQEVVCYVATWAVYRPDKGQFNIDDVNPLLCTHVVYSFVGIDDRAFTLVSLDPEYDINREGFTKAVALKQRNPKLKVTVAVGGWTEGSEKYSAMASTPATRQAFIGSVVEFIRKYNFDGLDLDWEYPANRGGKPQDKENFVQLCKELHNIFKDQGWLLTAAVGAGRSIIDSAYDIPRMAQYLDFIHLMAYDYHGRWDLKTGHNAPLYPRSDENELEQMLNVNFSVRYYLGLGAPLDKFILGLGLYGRTFLLNDTANPGIGSPARKSAFAGPYTREDGFLGYNEICEKLLTEKAWTLAWQEAHQAPYMFKENMWVSFDDPNSLGIKVAYGQRLGLAGVMIWSMDTDDFNGNCGPKFPLLTSINRNLALHAKDRFREKVAPIRPTPPTTRMRPTEGRPTEGRPTRPYDQDDLDRDKPHKTDIDFSPDNNDLDESRYSPIDSHKKSGGSSSTTSSALAATLVLSLAISSFFAA